MIAMLRREHELRLCDETQKKYAEAETSYTMDWMEVILGRDGEGETTW